MSLGNLRQAPLEEAVDVGLSGCDEVMSAVSYAANDLTRPEIWCI